MFFLQYLLALMITSSLAASCQTAVPVSTTCTNLGPLKELQVEGLVSLKVYDPLGTLIRESDDYIHDQRKYTLEIEINLGDKSFEQIRELLSIQNQPPIGFTYGDHVPCRLYIITYHTGTDLRKFLQKTKQVIGEDPRIHRLILQQTQKHHDRIGCARTEDEYLGLSYGPFDWKMPNDVHFLSISCLAISLATMPELDLCARSTYHNQN